MPTIRIVIGAETGVLVASISAAASTASASPMPNRVLSTENMLPVLATVAQCDGAIADKIGRSGGYWGRSAPEPASLSGGG